MEQQNKLDPTTAPVTGWDPGLFFRRSLVTVPDRGAISGRLKPHQLQARTPRRRPACRGRDRALAHDPTGSLGRPGASTVALIGDGPPLRTHGVRRSEERKLAYVGAPKAILDWAPTIRGRQTPRRARPWTALTMGHAGRFDRVARWRVHPVLHSPRPSLPNRIHAKRWSLVRVISAQATRSSVPTRAGLSSGIPSSETERSGRRSDR
jgi:hypothetical protein